MLRTSLRSVRVLGGRPVVASVARQWPAAASRRAAVVGQRNYAVDKKGNLDTSKPPVLPPSQTVTSERIHETTIDDVGETKAVIDEIPKNDVPRTPPPPPPAPPSPPKKKGFFRRLRNFVFTLLVLGAVGFAGGVWYSRMSDNFHDFFTEYIPYGEQAVLYLEELEYKKRFPNSSISKARDAQEPQDAVRIPAQSGASWRVANAGQAGRHSSAGPVSTKTKQEEPAKAGAPKPAVAEPKPATTKPAEPTPVSASQSEHAFKAPEVNEPSKMPPLKPIDLFSLADAKEPVVQDLVHMLNDLILVINADGAHGRYGSSVGKAKNEITKVGGKLKSMKAEFEKKAAKQVREKIDEFDKAATDLIDRVESAMITQEAQWRKDFEGEMKNVRENYEDRVKVLLQREQKLNEEKLQNQLAEQALALKKEFVKDVENQVEQERESRLGKLSALSTAVSEIEKLTTGWNDVLDSNLQTQQLHVAVEAVRTSLEDDHHPRPFIRELVALREIAAEDPVVNAAIASVNPAAYQRGISTSSQLIDRFRRVANEVRKASLLPDEAGVASHASSWVLSHVMFKKQGLADGNDVESVLTRTQTYLEEGDLDAAAREMNGLDGWAKTLSKDWLGEVRKVLEVQQALDVIATEARLQSLRVD
ncbi:hypothetical protein FZEAL_8919 [Fusarium zealandicum]|uniref:MICOS complex subunit MIC60 n=1 Tax=Fusarium zealandicum TaxID=1053134 RepID=A0A8H4UDH2_9HYPO|nr:hypothetical protein FZEAL_8919 [Fusarium zealandicum]